MRHAMGLMAAFVPVALLKAATPYQGITGVMEVLLGVVMVPVFSQLIQMAMNRERALPSEDKMIICVLGICFSVAGAGTLTLPFFSFGEMYAIFVVLAFGYVGSSAVGAAVGLLSGLSLVVGGAEFTVLGVLGLMGALFGVLRAFKRPVMTLGVVFANLAVYFVYPSIALGFPELLLACAVALLLPEQAWNYLKQFRDPTVHKQRVTEGYMQQVREDINLKLMGCALAIEDIAHAITPQTEYEREEITEFAETVAGTVCVACKEKSKCWSADFVHTYAAFEAMSAICHGEEAEEPVWLYERCANYQTVIQAMKDLSGQESETLRLRRALWESKVLAGRQLEQAGRIMKGMAGQDETYLFHAQLEQRLADAFAQEGIRLLQIDVKGEEALLVNLSVKAGRQQDLEQLVSRACGKEMYTVSRRVGKKVEHLEFAEAIKLEVYSGSMQVCSPGQEVCGDSCGHVVIDGSRQAVIISDGMGVGEQAAKESQMAVRMVHNLFRAGYDKTFILQTVNQLLMLNGEENYATLDICTIDAAKKTAEFIKVGAPPSYILYGGEVESIKGAALPIGILDAVTPSVEQHMLSGMEYIIMMSDGVYECAGEDDIKDWIKELRAEDCKGMAKELLTRAVDNGLQDDATVTVIATEAKGSIFRNNAELLLG
ncbi:SpoIIE family protein phosphatase, partial [Clostridia bacterium OttesenSCG-928-F22]|nr:SpoIIE family protein phosphatase [Clostridia bacterium OttesenSCG-928-F22]